MDTRDLSKIAMELTAQILDHELTKAEMIMLTALVSARVMSIVNNDNVVEPSTPIATEEVREAPVTQTTPAFKPKAVQYDSMYDPAPQMEVVQPPPREENPNTILASKGTACICDACKKVVYITNTDVADGMKVVDFIKAFTPTAGMPALNKQTEIENLNGKIATDCPACKTMKKLYLTGGPRV